MTHNQLGTVGASAGSHCSGLRLLLLRLLLLSALQVRGNRHLLRNDVLQKVQTRRCLDGIRYILVLELLLSGRHAPCRRLHQRAKEALLQVSKSHDARQAACLGICWVRCAASEPVTWKACALAPLANA